MLEDKLEVETKMSKTPEYVLRAMRNYIKSEKGIATRQKYKMIHKDKISEYNKDYQKKLRLYRKENNLCASCGNGLTTERDQSIRNKGYLYTTCFDCRQKVIDRKDDSMKNTD